MPRRKEQETGLSSRLLLLSVASALAALIAVAATLDDIGITWDEPHYYDSCRQQIAWAGRALSDFSRGELSAPFAREVLDRHWNFEPVYNVHPPFYKLCSSLTLVLFEQTLGPVMAYRLAPAVMFAVLAALLFFSVGQRYGVWTGFWAAAGFALMPRIFGHAHFGATDMPVTLLWFASALTFHRARESRKWAPVFALVYGLALSTKFTAFIIPLPLVAYAVLARKFAKSVLPLMLALVVSPLIMIALNPQWWHDTVERVYSYLLASASRSGYLHIPTYYLGKLYTFFVPWHHCLVLTLFTAPPLVLSGFLCGLWRTVRRPMADLWASHMALHWLVLMAVMMLPNSPGHDGVRLFLPSFVFLAVVSAKGFHVFTQEVLPSLAARLPAMGRKIAGFQTAPALIVGLMAIIQIFALARVHPFELCYYNSLAGGIAGAHKLGMESTYWYDPLNDEACELINQTLPDSSRVFARNSGHYLFLQRMGKIKPSLVFGEEEKGYDYLLQYYRQGTFGDHDWLLARRGSPRAALEVDGVRLLAIYQHPRTAREILSKLEGDRAPESYFDRALAYEIMGEVDSCLVELQQYLRYRPQDAKANMMMAVFCLERGSPRDAAGFLKRAGDDPEDPHAWNLNMGLARYRLGNREEAVSFFEQALRYRKHDPSALMALARLYYQMGDPDRALKAGELILRTQPYEEDALYLMGLINQRAEKTPEAKRYYTRLLELNSGHLDALIKIALLEQDEGGMEKSRDFFLRAFAVDSTDLQVNLSLGRLFKQAGDNQRVEKHYLLALRKNPDEVQAHLALAELYLKNPQRYAESLEHFRALARLKPEDAELIERQYIRPLEAALARKHRQALKSSRQDGRHVP